MRESRANMRGSGVLALLAVMVLACGGAGGKGASEPEVEADEPRSSRASGRESNMIPPEKFDEIRSFFARKSSVMSRCFVQGIDEGEIPKTAAGRLTLTATITPQGEVKNVRITAMEPRSQTLEQCAREAASRWTLSPLPSATEYSHTYQFDTL